MCLSYRRACDAIAEGRAGEEAKSKHQFLKIVLQ